MVLREMLTYPIAVNLDGCAMAGKPCKTTHEVSEWDADWMKTVPAHGFFQTKFESAVFIAKERRGETMRTRA